MWILLLRKALLQRTTRRVTVTPEGAAYYERTARVLKELEDIDSGFVSAHQRPRGRLRIDIGSSSASCVLIPALPDFIARYPDIRLDLGVGDRQVNLVGENVDCVVRGGSADELSLIARQLGRASWVTCATPEYLKRHGKPTHPDQLKNGHRIVSYVSARTGRVTPMRFHSGSERIEVGGLPGIGVNESSAHVAAGMAGLGIFQTFSFAVRDAIARGALLPILSAWQPDPYPFFLMYPPDRHMSQRLRVFIAWATERFANKFNLAT
ncbi:LysR family transcriptional regulator [Cupriavidus yeoncheonensis]